MINNENTPIPEGVIRDEVRFLTPEAHTIVTRGLSRTAIVDRTEMGSPITREGLFVKELMRINQVEASTTKEEE